MRRLMFVLLLLMAACNHYTPDCVKIGYTEDQVLKSCGKPKHVTYRNGRVFEYKYFLTNGQGDVFTPYLNITFDSDKVNYFKYESDELTLEKSE